MDLKHGASRGRVGSASPVRLLAAALAGAAGSLLTLLGWRLLRRRADLDASLAPRAAAKAAASGGSPAAHGQDAAPGMPPAENLARRIGGYALGFALAGGLTAASFAVAQSSFFYGPAVPIALIALAVAQIGVHLVFFLHITTGPDHINNVLALLFGTFVVILVILGSLWIMSHLNHAMMPMHLGDLPVRGGTRTI